MVKIIKCFCIQLFFISHLFAQFSKIADSLCLACNKQIADSERVKKYGQLASLYYIYQLDKVGDSVLQLQLKTAELTQDKQLILSVLFGNAITNIDKWKDATSFNNSLAFLQKGIDFAKANGMEDYLALAYTRIANLYKKRGLIDNAFYNANIAFITAQNINNDSIKIITSIELGDVYLAKNESLLAYKTYTSAYDKAVQIKNYNLQSQIFHRFAMLYQTFSNTEQAKENLFKSLALNKEKQNTEGMINDYIDLSRFTDEKKYLEKGLSLADSIKNEKYIIQAKRIMFGFYTYIGGNSDSTFSYINTDKDLKQLFINEGISNYNRRIGQVFLYSKKVDSALYYFKLAQTDFNINRDAIWQRGIYEEMASCYTQNHQPTDAINYYLKAQAIDSVNTDISKLLVYATQLSLLYEQQGDYKNSILYARKKEMLNENLQKLNNQRDLALLEVNNEKKKHELELQQTEEKKIAKNNLQYMGITVAITVLFLLLILMGMFQVKPFVIKSLSFFAFICLFEFVLLLIESLLHKISHGEPLKILLLKIVIIILMLPLQHYLEHGMKNLLLSQKLIKIRQQLSVKKLFQQQKKSATETINDIEKDTAIL